MTVSTDHRRLFEVELAPVAGSRFQPTGFPDLGAATFERPSEDGQGSVQCLVVESSQSMANRLEAILWDEGALEPVDTISDLPYLRIVADEDGEYLTSSRTEAHRLASAFVKDALFGEVKGLELIKQRLNLRDDRPIPPRTIAEAVLALDPFCLIHGVFFADSKWPGQPKVSRALTSFVEASDVQRAESGGVKFDDVRHSIGGTGGGSSEGYGTIPFHRTEWTAGRITAFFCLDRDQIRSYGLSDDATALLETLALWEVRRVLNGSLRLRTACDLAPVDDQIVDQGGEPLPQEAELEASVSTLVSAVAGDLETAGALEGRWGGGGARAKKAK